MKSQITNNKPFYLIMKYITFLFNFNLKSTIKYRNNDILIHSINLNI
jgi:hypothetical protein